MNAANLKALVQKWREPGLLEGRKECADELSREVERMESESGARTDETPETGALKACPFCGSDNIREAGRGLFYAECRDCHAYGPSHDEDSPYGLWAQQANEKWNRRTP